MVASLAEAMKKAQAKKGKGHPMHSAGNALIHPSFPPQGDAQPSFMGSQSAAPNPAMAQDSMLDPSNQSNPMNEGY